MASAGLRTIKTLFTGDAKGLIGASKDGESAVEGFSRRIGTASKAVLVAGAAIAAGVIKMADDLDSAYDTIRAGTGATGEAFEGLKKDFKAALVDVPDSVADVSIAITELSKRTGLAGGSLVQLAEQELRLARITGGDLKAQIASTTRAFGDWAISVDDQQDRLDEFMRASQQTGIGVEQLADSLVQFGAPLRQLGFKFSDAIALMASFEKAGVNTELVLGALKKALGAAAKAGKDPVKALKDLIAAIKGAGSVAKSNAIAVEALGVKAGPDFAEAVMQGRFEFAKLAEQIGFGSDTITSVTEDTADFAEMLQQLKNRAFVALEPVLKSVFEQLNKGAESLKGFGDWAEKNQGIVIRVAFALAGLAAAVLVVNAAMKVYAAWQAIVTAATWAFTTSVEANDVALALNPVGITVVAIIALVAAIIWAWNKFEGFRNVVKALWQAIQTAAVFIWEKGLKPAFSGIATAAVWLWESVLKPTWSGIITGIGWIVAAAQWLWSVMQPVFSAIGSIVSSVFNFFKSLFFLIMWGVNTLVIPAIQFMGAIIGWVWSSVIKPVFNFIQGYVMGLALSFQMLYAKYVQPYVQMIGGMIAWVWGYISPYFDKVMSLVGRVGDAFRSVFGAIGGYISSAFGGAVNGVRQTLNTLISVVNRAIGALNSNVIDNLNKIPGVSFGHLPSLPYLANGAGMLSPGMSAIVGDGGREVITALPGGGVAVQGVVSTRNDGPGAGGAMTVEIPIYIGDEVVKVVRVEIDRDKRTTRRSDLAGAGTR